MATAHFDPSALRQAFAHIPSAVVAVCADTGSERIGMAASTFMPISLDPALVAICVQDTSATWPRLAALPRLGISVLSTEHSDTVRVLASKVGDRFAGVLTETAPGGALFVVGSGLRLDVSIDQQITAGDHVIVLMRINDIDHAPKDVPAAEPILFHRSTFRTMAAS